VSPPERGKTCRDETSLAMPRAGGADKSGKATIGLPLFGMLEGRRARRLILGNSAAVRSLVAGAGSMIHKLAGMVGRAALPGFRAAAAPPAAGPVSESGPELIAEFVNLTLKDREKKRARIAGDVKRPILQDVDFALPAGAYAVLGDPVDRMALIDLLVGRRYAASGQLRLHTRISYPIGRVVFFSAPVTGADFVRFLSRLYHFDEHEALTLLRDVLPWPSILAHRLDDTRNQERLSLSLAVATFVEVETYIFDGNVVDPAFPIGFVRFLAEQLAARTTNRNIILSTRQYQVACSVATDSLVIEKGKLFIKEGVDPHEVKATALATASGAGEERPEDDADFLF